MRQGQCVYLPYVPLIPTRLGNARQGRWRICLLVSEKLIHERQIKPAPENIGRFYLSTPSKDSIRIVTGPEEDPEPSSTAPRRKVLDQLVISNIAA